MHKKPSPEGITNILLRTKESVVSGITARELVSALSTRDQKSSRPKSKKKKILNAGERIGSLGRNFNTTSALQSKKKLLGIKYEAIPG